MYHTEIDLPDETAAQLLSLVEVSGKTVQQFVQQAVEHELQRQSVSDLQIFFDGLAPLQSFASVDAIEYVDQIRSNSRIIHE